MTKLGEALPEQGHKGGDDYLHNNCVKCNESGFDTVENEDGKMVWLCEEHFWNLKCDGLSPCCGAPSSSANDTICSQCGEHY